MEVVLSILACGSAGMSTIHRDMLRFRLDRFIRSFEKDVAVHSHREFVPCRDLNRGLHILDVQMPGCDGFDVLQSLGGEAPRAIVFVTAYDRYALKALEVEALDYLLKPFDDARFLRTLARAKDHIRRSPGGAMERLIVRSAGRVSFLRTSEIDWIEAEDYYACLHVAGKAHLLRRKMADLERDLDPGSFCRIHRSAIVNLDRVRELQMGAGGEYEAVLKDGTRLRVSRRYRERLMSVCGKA